MLLVGICSGVVVLFFWVSIIGCDSAGFCIGCVESIDFAFLIKSRGSTLYCVMRLAFKPLSTQSKNDIPASPASVSVKGQYG